MLLYQCVSLSYIFYPIGSFVNLIRVHFLNADRTLSLFMANRHHFFRTDLNTNQA